MKLTLTQFLTLDGVIQAPGGPEEDTSGGFTHGGWSFPYGDEDFLRFVTEVFDRADAFLLGRRTYDIFASYWPRHTDPADPIASRLNALPKHVASTTLTAADWQGAQLIGREDLVKDVTALKEQPGRELQLHGSAGLAQSLLRHDLIDTLHLLTFPVALGTGKRLFADGGLPTAFRHTGARTTSKGVAIHTYERDGRPEYGSY
ncbi:dihydrofolate reductase family protein [Streptomyces flavofungini]|uniref:Dihydrofolate reductase family protein n=1 Tax=Streptomyces flavofungini TaxID=68200 RepID=A0ABS0X4Q2_9ACTN|nr:dihydrofolate reductase family protein [Streptomyces flavofungini]MBJ3808170.1 dihydrofolate reductase family protein [Streptomyces flavofungini]GHC56797.1 deaminase reductase [Streptomyces flavofungini]